MRILRERSEKANAPCHICKKPIDYSLRHPDPGAFQADHAIPLSMLEKGDPARQSLSNLAASHAHCNQSKGNGTRTLKNTPPRVTPKKLWG